MEHLYLDAASTEPVDGNVISVMMPFLTEAYANPMSVHSAGKTAARFPPSATAGHSSGRMNSTCTASARMRSGAFR